MSIDDESENVLAEAHAMGEETKPMAFNTHFSTEGSLSNDGKNNVDQRPLRERDHPGNGTIATRQLARITQIPPIDLNGTALRFSSAVPVFGSDESYLALLHEWNDNLWQNLSNLEPISCATPDGEHQAEVELWGGETNEPSKGFMALHCKWPSTQKWNRCHQVVLQVGLAEEGTQYTSDVIEVCHDPALQHEASYKLAACAPLSFHDPSQPDADGVVLLPQWLEWNLNHGVEQFLFYISNYTQSAILNIFKPYVEQGLAKFVVIDIMHLPVERMAGGEAIGFETSDPRWARQLQANDCLYRMKHTATWLMPTIDADEYVLFMENRLLVEALSKYTRYSPPVHALTFGRLTFLHPARPLDTLQISSTRREDDLEPTCPKYIVQPKWVNALFIHWPTSWANATVNIGLGEEVKVAHFRTTNSSTTGTDDITFSSDAPELEQSLCKRFGSDNSSWFELSRRLTQECPDANTSNCAHLRNEFLVGMTAKKTKDVEIVLKDASDEDE
eukprot:gnl/TRDRNA2_/TRDRNA2_35246_c0_seq2.p1 gnl/TRDRNA2_/TRDRNA2_35246_c0~~gnl/TRDRNA2_/TRDRNA2_35246_c0_seq2.p1  ORF type:complete len:503 (-),score=47.50 gnl/TRDRNA2_/TRDRNA2_35246_c0_seq2:234-1742(-)